MTTWDEFGNEINDQPSTPQAPSAPRMLPQSWDEHGNEIPQPQANSLFGSNWREWMASQRQAARQRTQAAEHTAHRQNRQDLAQAHPWVKSPVGLTETAMLNIADVTTIGNLPRIGAAVGASIQEPTDAGRWLDTYRKNLATARERLRVIREKRPIVSGAGTLVGGAGAAFAAGPALLGTQAIPGVGGWLARAAAGRGFGATAAQVGSGAATGAMFGGLYGASAAEEEPEEIAKGAAEGAGWGSLFGGVMPVLGRTFGAREAWQRILGGSLLGGGAGGAAGAVFNPEDPVGGARTWGGAGALAGAGLAGGGRPAAIGLGKMARSGYNTARVHISDWARQANAIMSGRTNALLPGAPPMVPPVGGGGAGGGSPWNRRETTNVLTDLLNRGVTPKHLEERAALAEATGHNPVSAQVLGEAGVQRLQTLGSLPGKTPQLAADVISERRQGQLQRLVSALDEAAQTDKSAFQAGRILEDEFERIGAEMYDPILYDQGGAPRVVSAAAKERLEGVLARMPAEIIDATETSMQRVAQMRGEPMPQPGEARFYHNFYRALGTTIRNLERNPNAIQNRLFGPDDLAALKTLRKEGMRPAMDDAIMGYRNARHSWAGMSDAEEALEWGGGILQKNKTTAEEIAAEWESMTPFEKDFARIGLRDQMRLMMAETAREGVRKRNVADLFSDSETRAKLRIIFGEKTDRFLKQLSVEDLEFNELGSAIPRAGSKTAPVFADVLDQMANQGGAQGFVNQAGNWVWRTAFSPMFEAWRNRQGRALLQELTPSQIRELRRLLRARLSREQWSRLRRAKEAGQQGAVGGLWPLGGEAIDQPPQ